jgi:hypothetical protein
VSEENYISFSSLNGRELRIVFMSKKTLLSPLVAGPGGSPGARTDLKAFKVVKNTLEWQYCVHAESMEDCTDEDDRKREWTLHPFKREGNRLEEVHDFLCRLGGGGYLRQLSKAGFTLYID